VLWAVAVWVADSAMIWPNEAFDSGDLECNQATLSNDVIQWHHSATESCGCVQADRLIPHALIVSLPGASCRQQIAPGTKRRSTMAPLTAFQSNQQSGQQLSHLRNQEILGTP